METKVPRQAGDVLKDPKKCLGSSYDPARSYSLVIRDSPIGQRRLREGWTVCLDNLVDGLDATPMILIVAPKDK